MLTMRKNDNRHKEQQANELKALREQIDALDATLLETLAKRAQLVDQIGKYKKSRGLEPLDSTRWQQVLQTNIARAETLGICPEFVETLYHLIHEYSLHLESNSEPHS
ncbi:MAG: 3-deoxy-D-arabino-heptulosonate 7-phosphate synthase [Vampirovibrio sp.]|nr:3-deoxy-D-arabino-heptulosonate 7-phosphate synthase [Vampirovibrio sp.]